MSRNRKRKLLSLVGPESVPKEEPTSKKRKTLDVPPKKKIVCVSYTKQIELVSGHLCRKSFNDDLSRYHRFSYLIERNLSPLILRYTDWFDYPKGDFNQEGHSDSVWAVKISNDGRHMYTGSSDGTIIHWNLLDYSLIDQWKAHPNWVLCLDLKCGEQTLNTIIKNIDDHRKGKSIVSISGLLASGGGDNQVRVWDAYKHTLLATMKGHTNDVRRVQFGSKKNELYSCSDDYSVRLWCIETATCLKSFINGGHNREVYSLARVPGMIVTGSSDRSMIVWDPKSTKKIFDVTLNGRINHICFNSDYSMVSCSSPFTRVYKWPTMSKFRNLRTRALTSCFHPWIPHIIALGEYAVQIYDLKRRKYVFKSEPGSHAEIHELCFTPDGSRLVVVRDFDTILVLDLSSLHF